MEQDFESDASIAVADKVSDTKIQRLSPLAASVRERFDRANTARTDAEQRWLKCYYNYRGLYGKEIAFTDTEKSRVFVKITKTKVWAAFAQLGDILFSAGRMPITIDPTPVPEGIAAAVHIDMDDPAEADEAPAEGLGVGFPGDGKDLAPGEKLSDRIGAWLAEKFKGAKVKDGPGVAPASVTLEPAKLSAKRMEKQIHDQLDEAGATTHFRHALFEMVCLGTGVLKGPFTVSKEYPRWKLEDGVYDPVVKDVPQIEYVSVWNFYPDPEATGMHDADYIIQRHRMTRAQLRGLKRRPAFRDSAIDKVLLNPPNYERLWWESEIDDNSTTSDTTRYEVLEYWGTVDAELLHELDVPIPDDLKDAEDFHVNVWLCGDELLRVVLNQFTPRRIPFLACPYEINPYNFFGVGLAENMEDAQTLMNGFTRLAVDNAVLSGNLLIEIDETYLSPGQDTKVYPGKVFRRNGGNSGQAIYGTKWPNTSQENMMMFDRFRQIADESTGIPSFSHGSTGVTGTGRTAAGMSMLMGAATLNIKAVVKNIDDYFLDPIGKALFSWNMQFNFDPTIKGDLDVNARGTASLMMREVKSQRLIQFMQVASNPVIAPRVRWGTLISEIASTMDLDPEKLLADPEEAQLQAALMGLQNQGQGQPAQGAPSPMDQIGGGGGNIGVGAPPMPGENQFSGTPQTPGMGPSGSPADTTRVQP